MHLCTLPQERRHCMTYVKIHAPNSTIHEGQGLFYKYNRARERQHRIAHAVGHTHPPFINTSVYSNLCSRKAQIDHVASSFLLSFHAVRSIIESHN